MTRFLLVEAFNGLFLLTFAQNFNGYKNSCVVSRPSVKIGDFLIPHT